MKYHILKEHIVFDDHFKIIKAKIRHDTFQGDAVEVTRFAFERGDSVAILLFEKDSKSFLLTRQFRYPTCKHNKGWIDEIVAGTLEAGETPEMCIIREVKEELGYRIESPQHIHTCYTSPGGSTEKMFIYFAEVSSRDKKYEGGGAKEENEFIQTVRISESELESYLKKTEDAKTLIAFQWYLLHKK